MRIKKACQVTGLTERAVRLYVKKGLLRPAVREGLLDFSAEDVHRLRDIALLRYLGFTLEQIGTMAADDGAVPSVAIQRRETARAEALQSGEAAERSACQGNHKPGCAGRSASPAGTTDKRA